MRTEVLTRSEILHVLIWSGQCYFDHGKVWEVWIVMSVATML